MPEFVHTRTAWLELRQELLLVNDGYEFLDEKRILLAAEMLRQRAAYRAARKRFTALCETAMTTLQLAAADQGLNGLQLYPAAELSKARVRLEERPSIGQIMIDAQFDAGETEATAMPVRPSPEVRACAESFGELLAAGTALAAMTANLTRLMYEYRRTERRVRALENIVLPEIRDNLAMMEDYLDLVEQEEVIRVRTVRTDRA